MTVELDQLALDRSMVDLERGLPALERWAAFEQKAILQAVRGKIDAGTLTGEAAMMYWAAFLAHQGIADSLRAKLRVHMAGLNRKVGSAMLSPRAPVGPEAV